MSREKSSTLIDVAKRAGVSTATVSRYLNGMKVRPSFAIRVAEAIDQLGYRPNQAARSIKGQKSGTIGIILPDVEHPYFSAMLEGALQQARLDNTTILIGSCSGKQEYEDKIIDQFSYSILDGLIYTPVARHVNLVEIEAFRNLPVVIAARAPSVYPELPHVYQDTFSGGYLSAKYLLSMGYRRIAFLASFWEPSLILDNLTDLLEVPGSAVYSSLFRFRGYLKALEEFDVPYDSDLIKICSYGIEDGRQAIKQLLAQVTGFDAVVTASDYVACGVIEILESQGISVPNDVSVMGYGDLQFGKMVTPRLSSVNQHMIDLGRYAVKALDMAINNETVDDLKLDVEVVVRESTCKKRTRIM